MRFDNAFLTKNGAVGMQFIDGKQTLTVYPDNNGNLIFSEEATDAQKASLTTQYARRKGWYKKK